LEGCLRSISSEIARQGSQITLRGLGPSPRAINRRDTTVISVQRDDGATVIHADVQFQASAFLGTAAQDAVVQEKLDRIFDDMLTQLGITAWPRGPETAGAPEGVADGEKAVIQSEEQTTPEMATVAAPGAAGTPDLVREPVRETGPEATPTDRANDGRETAGNLAAETQSPVIEPEPRSAESAVHESARQQSASQGEPPVIAAPMVAPEGIAPSFHAAVDETKATDSAPFEKPDRQEELRGAAEEVTAPQAEQPEAAKTSNAADADGASKVAEDNAAARVERTPEKIDLIAMDAATTVEAVKSQALRRAHSSEEMPAKPEAAGANSVVPTASAEAAKPISAPAAFESEVSERSAKATAEESKPVPANKKVEATEPGVIKTPASTSEPARNVLKPVFSRAASGNAPSTPQASEPKPTELWKGTFGAYGVDEEQETGSKVLKWSAWVAALIVLVVAPLVWLYMPSHSEMAAAPAAQPATAEAAPAPVVAHKVPGENPDPAVVVDDWAAAMNSRDAAAQAAFYADPVERYFLRHNLTREQVKADKQAAIDRRKGDWAVKMESIRITHPDDRTARAHLIKHYSVKEDGKTASEWFVPSVLQMTRTNGKWQITSERDLGWATSLDELGY